jgi:hypothetical protein
VSEVVERLRLYRSITKQLESASLDELRVIAFVVERLCMLGHAAYGPLDLRTDKRDFDRELDEEIVDALVYVACARLKSSAGRRG